jgi:hypothetical protein
MELNARQSVAKRGAKYRWRSSFEMVDRISIAPFGEGVEQRLNTWQGSRMPCLSLPWKSTSRNGNGSRESKRGRNATCYIRRIYLSPNLAVKIAATPNFRSMIEWSRSTDP